jgi:hypothetical protein
MIITMLYKERHPFDLKKKNTLFKKTKTRQLPGCVGRFLNDI